MTTEFFVVQFWISPELPLLRQTSLVERNHLLLIKKNSVGDPLSALDCSFTGSSLCEWNDDPRDTLAKWRVLYMDRWTGESVCMTRVHSRRRENLAAVAKLWSPLASSICVSFAFKVHGAGRLSVLKHAEG